MLNIKHSFVNWYKFYTVAKRSETMKKNLSIPVLTVVAVTVFCVLILSCAGQKTPDSIAAEIHIAAGVKGGLIVHAGWQYCLYWKMSEL